MLKESSTRETNLLPRFAMRPCGIFIVVGTLLGLLLPWSAVSRAQSSATPEAGKDALKDTLVYVGTYSREKSKGIYLFRLQPKGTEVFQNVTLVPLGLAAETPNPSSLEIDLKHRRLFAVTQGDESGDNPTGEVSSFSIDTATGQLTLVNQQSSMGNDPCRLTLDREGRHLLVANCKSGSVAVLPVDADGRLGEPTDFLRYGRTSNPPVQERRPLTYAVTLDPGNRFAVVSDAESDKVMVYRFNAENGKLTPSEPVFTPIKQGAGPGPIVFRPDGLFAYVLNQLDSTVDAFAYDPETGRLEKLQTLSTLPGYFEGPNIAVHLEMHPSGKYLFASNDGHNSVVLFTIDLKTGTLSWVEEQGTGGAVPRHFGIDPSGAHLAIANQASGTVLAARIDAGNGRLKPSGLFAEVPSPACVKFLPPLSPGP